MKLRERKDPNLLVGDVVARVRGLGLVLLFFGLLPWLDTILVFRFEKGTEYAFKAIFALIACLGIGIIVYRERFTLDRRRERMTTRRGFLIPLWSREESYAGARYVDLMVHYLRDGPPSYRISIAREENSNVRVASAGDYIRSRNAALRIAEFLELGFRDRTGSDESVWESGSLGDAFVSRLASSTEFPVGHAMDPRLIQLVWRGDALVVEIPAPKLVLRVIWCTAIVAVMVSLPPVFLGSMSGAMRFYLSLWFATIPLFIAVILYRVHGMNMRIEASTQGVRLQRKQWFRMKEFWIPRSDLQKIRIGGYGGVDSAKSHRIDVFLQEPMEIVTPNRSFELGRHLPREERSCLYVALCRALLGESGRRS